MAYCKDLSLYEYSDDADEPGRSDEGTSLLNVGGSLRGTSSRWATSPRDSWKPSWSRPRTR